MIRNLTQLPVAAAVLGFSAMAAIGWKLGANSETSTAVSGPAAGPEQHRPARRVRPVPGPAGEAGRQLAAIRASRDPGERMRATVELASMLSPSEFAAWMDGGWFSIRGGAELTLFTKIIQERWKQEDPEGLLLWSLKNKSNDAAGILASWAASDPQKLVDFFKSHPDNRAELQALATIAKTDPALALRRLQELTGEGLSRNDGGYAGGLLQQLAKQSPAALEAALESFPAELKTRAEIVLIGLKMEKFSAEELQKLQDRPDGIKILTGILESGGHDSIKEKIFDQLAGFPSSWRSAIASNAYYFVSEKNSAKWAAADLESLGFSKQQSAEIRLTAISRMTDKQPEEALRLLGGMEVEADVRRNVLQNIFQNLRDKPERADALLAQLDSEEERQTARAMIAAPQSDSGEINKVEKPADWLAQVAALDPKQGTPYQYLSVLRTWDSEKLGALTEQFKSMPDESKLKLAKLIAGNGFSDKGPLEGEAIRYLVANPQPVKEVISSDPFSNGPRDPIQLASGYIQKTAQNDPAAASEWIQSLPAGDAKLWASKNLHSLWSQYDPKAADQWMKSLPAATQTQVKSLGKKPSN